MPVVHGEKRLLNKTTPYPTIEEALDAAYAQQQSDHCCFAYVDEELRVVGIYEYNDVHPDLPVCKGQQRVQIPVLK